MAIIIPSKHIYSIEDNSKLLKNKVDRVEYSQKIVDTKIEEDNVYNTSANVGFLEDESQHKTNSDIAERMDLSNSYWDVAFVQVEQIPIYFDGIIIIPKYFNMYSIQTLNDISNNYSIYVNQYQGEIIGSAQAVNIFLNSTSVNIKYKELLQNSLINKSIIWQDNFKTIAKEEKFISPEIGVEIIAHTEISFDDNETNIYLYNEDNDNYYISAHIFCGITNISFGGHNNIFYSGIITTTMDLPLNGNYITYSPTRIDFSFNGQKVSIDVKEENLSIGNGKNIYNYEDSNELMQSTNTPTLNTRLQKIIDKWKDGREIAVLECGIADYYNDLEYIITVVGTGSAGYYNYIDLRSNYPLNIKVGDKIKIPPNYDEIEVSRVLNNGLDIRCDAPYSVTLPPLKSSFIYSTGSIVKIKDNGDTFKLHEQVIPYIYRGLGLGEEPMSLKKNGEPKVFEVIGREISYEGVPLQKITILEV